MVTYFRKSRFLERVAKATKPVPTSGIVAGSGIAGVTDVLELQLSSSPGPRVKRNASLIV
jgi:hypothetical protein